MTRSFIFCLTILLTLCSVALGESSSQQIIYSDDERSSRRVRNSGGFLDVGVVEVTKESAERLKLKQERGALINFVGPDGPALKAGLRADDVIVKWNGSPIESAAEFWRLKRETPAGRTVRLGLIRDGREIETSVTLGEYPDRPFRYRGREVTRAARAYAVRPRVARAVRPATAIRVRDRYRVGVALQSLSPQLAEYFGLQRQYGALVTFVQSDSPAARAGLRAGDVLTSVAGETIEGPADVRRITRGKAGESVQVKFMRDRQERTLTLQLDKSDSTSMLAPDEYDEFVFEQPEIVVAIPEIELADIAPIAVPMPRIELNNIVPRVVPVPRIKIPPIRLQMPKIDISPIKVRVPYRVFWHWV